MKRYGIKNKKPVDSELIPRGENGLAALSAFYQAGVYDQHAYPKIGPKPLDTHEGLNYLYGRVDHKMSPIFLAEDNLKQLPVGKQGKTLFALNFVVDAFNEMLEYFQEAKDMSRIEKTQTVFQTMEAKRAWTGEIGIHQMYGKHMEELYTSFVGGYLNSHLHQEITNFESFLKIFLAYLSLIGYTKPITRTGYITSYTVSPLSSGLMIELVEGKHDDDYGKYLGFIRDNNFSFFTRTCERFGFLVDRNAPWRIIADVTSPYMKEKMQAYGASTMTQGFSTYYLRAANYEIDNLRIRMYQIYDLYVQQNPDRTILTPTSSTRPDGTRVRITYEQRERETIESIDAKYGREFWLRLFIYLRAIECKKSYSQREFENSVRKASEYMNYVGEYKAIEYIEKNYRHSHAEAHKNKKSNNSLTEPEGCDILKQNINKRASFRPSFHF